MAILSLLVGNKLEFISPSTGIILQGESLYGNFLWDISTCTINILSNNLLLQNESDIIWFHRICSGKMSIGSDINLNNNNYTTRDNELDTCN